MRRHSRPARNSADLAASAGHLKVVLAAAHHAIDAITRVAACDIDAVRDAASGRCFTCQSACCPSTTTSSPLRTPAAPTRHRTARNLRRGGQASLRAGRPLENSGDLAHYDGLHQMPLPGPPPGVLRTQTDQIEDILRSLDITEAGMLLRAAAAIDDAAQRPGRPNASVGSRNATASTSNHRSGNQEHQAKATRTAAKAVMPVGAVRCGRASVN